MTADRFTVRRLNWQAVPGPGPAFVRLPGATPLAEFDTPDAAYFDWGRRELAVRRGVNPFRCGAGLAAVTTLPAFALRDWLLDAGVRPPKSDSFARTRWAEWWDAAASGWSPDQRAKVWEALDKLRFYDVIPRPADASVFVVATAGVNDLAIRAHRHLEGGNLHQAFRRRADAEAYRDLLQEAQFGPQWGGNRRPSRNPFRAWEPEPEPANESRVHVAEVLYPDGVRAASGGSVFVVARIGLDAESATFSDEMPVEPLTSFRVSVLRSPSQRDWYYWDADTERDPPEELVVPEAAFADRSAAEAFAAAADRDFRRFVNPFALSDLAGWVNRRWLGTERLAAFGPEFPRPDRRTADALARWWARHVDPLSDDPFHAAWDIFHRLRFYRVVELPIE